MEQGIEKARKALQGTTEDHLMMPWRFVMGGKLLYEMPRHVMLTDAVILLAIVAIDRLSTNEWCKCPGNLWAFRGRTVKTAINAVRRRCTEYVESEHWMVWCSHENLIWLLPCT